MISFLNSILLPALTAALIPLIIHLFNRRKTKKVLFSSLYFLKTLESKRIKQIRLYQILLILLRMLFILFLVLAFTRPTLHQHLLGNTAGSTAIIVLDDSYSMQRYINNLSYFDEMKNRAEIICNNYDKDEPLFMLTLSDTTLYSGKENILERLKNCTATNYSPSFKPAMQKVEQVFADYPNFNKELYLCTDFYINNRMADHKDLQYLGEGSIQIFTFDNPANETFQNLSIDSVSAVSGFFEINRAALFSLKIGNYSQSESIVSAVSLFSGNKRLASKELALDPSESREVRMNFVPRESGHHFLHFELDDDDLDLDNHWYSYLYIPDRIRVLYVKNKEQFLLEKALEALSQKSSIDVDMANYKNWQSRNFNQYSSIVLDGLPALNRATVNRLKDFQNNGNSILIIPGDKTEVLNNTLNELAPGTRYGALNSVKRPKEYYKLHPIDMNHPAFSSFYRDKKQPEGTTRVYKYYTLQGEGSALIKLTNNDPMLLQINENGGRMGAVYLFAGKLDADWNTIPFAGYFLPVLYKLFYINAGSIVNSKTQTVDTKKLSFTIPKHSYSQKFYLSHSNERSEIIPQQTAQGSKFVFDRLPAPGHYSLLGNKELLYSISLNHSSRELQPPYLNINLFSKNVYILDSSTPLKEQVAGVRLGQELWIVFLFLALLSIVMEMVLIRLIEGRKVPDDKKR